MLAGAVIVIAVAVAAWAATAPSPSASAQSRATAGVSHSPHPSRFALRSIPAAYLHDYWRAAREYGLDWTKLAAVGQIESDQGRSQTPGVAQGTNPAGATGPAQFLRSTWARYGVDADGRGNSNPYDPADAITAMAAYLKASGAPQDWRAALHTYNHSTAYVDAVLALSRRYLGS
ncbi:MAG TPA: lytic transglycosylase domain-containing protein [Solirubrobacteraceae bacterium]|jgi:membrane-bound lytic murein transglycosylase B|nr:lytic transglycosylase domain-containing protein [Solirubrobacteraceae bacterium]